MELDGRFAWSFFSLKEPVNYEYIYCIFAKNTNITAQLDFFKPRIGTENLVTLCMLALLVIFWRIWLYVTYCMTLLQSSTYVT